MAVDLLSGLLASCSVASPPATAADTLDWHTAFLASLEAILGQLRRVPSAGSAAAGAQAGAQAGSCWASVTGHVMEPSQIDASLRFLQLLAEVVPAERWSLVWQQVGHVLMVAKPWGAID